MYGFTTMAIELVWYELVGIAVVVFLSGFGFGYLVGREFSEDVDENMRRKIALLIAVMWALSVLGTIFIPGYQTSIWVHAIMGAMSGYLFGVDNPVRDVFGGR